MKKISLEQIDKWVDELNEYSLEKSEELLDKFANDQPAYFAYIMQESFELLGEDEHELLLFSSMTLWLILKNEYKAIEAIDEADIDDAQDKNWEAIEKLPPLKGQSFDDYVEPLIANHPQDELLYYVLDTMQDDEEGEFVMNKESKVPIFVALKSFVDAVL